MNEDVFLSALHDDPTDEVTWLALADWLDEDGQPGRAELVRLVRQLTTQPISRRTRQRAAQEGRLRALLAAGTRPVVAELTNSVGVRLALVPPGRFRMGSPRSERDRHEDEAAHVVTLTRPFYLGVFLVTQGQYRAVTRANPSAFRAGGPEADHVAGMDTRSFPVDCTSWEDAQAFCKRLMARRAEKAAGRTYRLATEAEWEYACRAGTTTAFHFGDSLSHEQANFGNHLARPCPVGSYPPNAFGLYDMHGNMSEKVHDVYTAGFPAGPRTDPTGPEDGESRVSRGAAYDDGARKCRSANRTHGPPNGRYDFVGFRLAMDWVSPAGPASRGRSART